MKPAAIQGALGTRLLTYADNPVSVMLRTAAEMATVLDDNLSVTADPKHSYVIFLNDWPVGDALARTIDRTDEGQAE